MNFHRLPLTYNILDPVNIDIQSSEFSKPILSKTLHLYLNRLKKQIELFPTEWDNYKRYTNPYEFIHTSIPSTKQSICKLKPLSRSFYKMIEIYNSFYLFDKLNENIKCFSLAEGPGGFIEALCVLRQTPKDIYYGMTLINDDINVPGWKKARHFLSENKNVIIESGATGTGDLLNVENLKYCYQQYHGQMDIITGDGGFDFSIDFNKQESNALKLIVAQVCFAISMQKIQGHFILKMFDTFTQASIDILYLLNLLYENIYIMKPYTSRYGNSERYIICKNFLVKDVTPFFHRFVDIYHKLDTSQTINRLLNIEIPYYFITKLEEYNAILGQQQIETISSTLSIIENPRNEKLEQIKKNNIKNCIQWCQKNRLPCIQSIQQTNIFLTKKTTT